MMNVCLVDDQRAVVDSLKNGIRWEKLPVDKVYTACSAREAKLILKNFPVDVLLSDIEMPEEDGISLCLWAKKEIADIECIFLTSHADFEYAREAIRLGSFDYILQPVRYEDVEKALLRVWERVCEKQKMQNMINSQRLFMEQKNHMFDVLTANIMAENWAEAEQLYSHLPELYGVDAEECQIYPALLQVVRWKKLRNDWEKKLVSLVLKNVLEELFIRRKGMSGSQASGKTVTGASSRRRVRSSMRGSVPSMCSSFTILSRQIWISALPFIRGKPLKGARYGRFLKGF